MTMERVGHSSEIDRPRVRGYQLMMASAPKPDFDDIYPVVDVADDESYLDFLRSEGGYIVALKLPNGRWAGIARLLYHWTMHAGEWGDMVGHSDRWCYRTFDDAATALNNWILVGCAGKPEGWHREPYTGLRRDGDREWFEP